MKYSILFDVDSYKSCMWKTYKENTKSMFSYVESRGGLFPFSVMFGLQYYLKEYLSKPISVEEVEKAKVFFAAHGEPFNYDGWMYIAKELKGKLPVRIRAVSEGSVIPTHNALLTIESTDSKVFWLPSWLETSLLRNVWYGVNVATRSYTIKKIIKEALDLSSDNPDSEIDFKLHDFGSRGVSSQESAMIGGAAHLVNFKGSDTVAGVLMANEYYHSDMAGFSIPASEHSNITSWGKENEVHAYRNMLKQFAKPNSLVAIVSDSYDLCNAITNHFGTTLKEDIIKSGATVIIRPDSGIPHEVVLKSLQLLDEKFGHTINSKGFKVLNNVRVIQGDGINEGSIRQIISNVIDAGYSLTNVSFGMGGQLLQAHDRDTNKFAMKCSSITSNNEERDVFKDPITDKGKQSKKGRLDLILDNMEYKTVKLEVGVKFHPNSIMRTVFENGEILIDESLETIRNRANKSLT